MLVTELTFFGAGAFTVSLAMQPGDAAFPFTSASTLLVQRAGGAADSVPATCGGAPCAVAASADGTAITVTGLTHGGLDDETWTLSLADGGATLLWAATRTVREEHAVLSDRLAFAFQTIGSPPIHGNQIPSWLDTEMRFNETAGAGFALGDGQFEFLSAPAQTVKWAPTGAVQKFAAAAAGASGDGAAFSFAKPAMDGTSHTVTLGVQAVGARAAGAPAALPAGAVLTRSFSLTALPDGAGNFPSLNFTLPASPGNDRFAALVREFASIQNMFEGFLMGNNPASVVCLHEMGWYVPPHRRACPPRPAPNGPNTPTARAPRARPAAGSRSFSPSSPRAAPGSPPCSASLSTSRRAAGTTALCETAPTRRTFRASPARAA